MSGMDEFDSSVGTRAQFDAPTIASVMRLMAARPAWAIEEPIEIDGQTFAEALREMKEIQRRQGRSVTSAPWIKQRNFLLRGIAVVTNDLED